MTATTEQTLSSAEVCRLLGVSRQTVFRMHQSWYPDTAVPAEARRILLSPVDVMVARAWIILETTAGVTPARSWFRSMVETAIRRDPRPWLLITSNSARTCDTAAEAAVAWSRSGACVGQAIHLEVQP